MRERFSGKFGAMNHFGTPVAIRRGFETREFGQINMPSLRCPLLPCFGVV